MYSAGFAALVMVLGTACGDDDVIGDGDKPDSGEQIVPDGGGTEMDGGQPDGGGQDGGGGNIDGGQLIDAGDASNPGGDGGTGTGLISASAQSISFGTSPCGGSALAAKTLTVTNSGTAAVTWSASLSSTSAFGLSTGTSADGGVGSLSGTLSPGGNQVFTVTPSAVAASATAGQNINATITVQTNLPPPFAVITIPVSITPLGANVQLTPSSGPRWGQVAIDSVTPIDPIGVTLRNTGNAPANVTITQPSETAFSLRTSLDVNSPQVTAPFTLQASGAANNGNQVAYGARFAPTIIKTYTSQAAVAVAAPVCNGGTPSIQKIDFEGSGTAEGLNTFISADLPQFTGCGTTGSALPSATITVHNYRPDAVPVSAEMLLGNNSPYTVTPPTLMVPSGTDGFLTVTLKDTAITAAAVPATELRGRVVVTTPRSNGMGTNDEVFLVKTTVQGAVLSIDPVDPFNNGAANSADSNQVVVRNTGNLAVNTTLTTGGSDAARFAVTQQAGLVGNGTGQATVEFTPEPNDTTVRNATLAVSAAPGEFVCDPQPVTAAINGRAKSPSYELVGGLLTIPFNNHGGSDDKVLCPAGVYTNSLDPDPTFITSGVGHTTIRNNGVDSLHWTAALGRGDRFLISTGGGPTGTTLEGDLLTGQTATIDIQPRPILWPATTGDNDYGDVLVLGANTPGFTPDPINLRQTAVGGILGYYTDYGADGFGLIHRSQTQQRTPLFYVTNYGNAVTNFEVDYTYAGQVGSTANGSAYYMVEGEDVDRTMPGLDVGSVPALANGTNGATPFNATFHPFRTTFTPSTDIGQSSLSVGLRVPTDPVCARLPTSGLQFDATATDANISWNYAPMATINVPGLNVNTFATDTGSLTLTNAGNLALYINSIVLADAPNGAGPGEGGHFDAFIGTGGTTSAIVYAASQGAANRVSITLVPKRLTPAQFNAIAPTSTTCTSGASKVVSENVTIATQVQNQVEQFETYTLQATYSCP